MQLNQQFVKGSTKECLEPKTVSAQNIRHIVKGFTRNSLYRQMQLNQHFEQKYKQRIINNQTTVKQQLSYEIDNAKHTAHAGNNIDSEWINIAVFRIIHAADGRHRQIGPCRLRRNLHLRRCTYRRRLSLPHQKHCHPADRQTTVTSSYIKTTFPAN